MNETARWLVRNSRRRKTWTPVVEGTTVGPDPRSALCLLEQSWLLARLDGVTKRRLRQTTTVDNGDGTYSHTLTFTRLPLPAKEKRTHARG